MNNVTNNDIGMKPEDYAKIESQVIALKSGERMSYAIICGLGATIISAFLWAFVTAGTGYQIGFMAIAVGFLVGKTIRYTGKGVSKEFGILGAVFSIVGCILGNILSIIIFSAQKEGIPMLQAFALADYRKIPSLMAEAFSPIDLLFYGIAIYEGYRFSFKPLNEFEMLEKVNAETNSTQNNPN